MAPTSDVVKLFVQRLFSSLSLDSNLTGVFLLVTKVRDDLNSVECCPLQAINLPDSNVPRLVEAITASLKDVPQSWPIELETGGINVHK